jgi:hypothetical protein
MNDVDEDVSGTLHRLMDHEPVDADRALLAVRTSEAPSRRRVPGGLGVLGAIAVAAAVALVAVTAPTKGQQAPSFKLVGAAGAEVVVRVDGSGAQPTAELTIGDTTVTGTELHGTPTEGGFSFDASDPMLSPPPVDVPEGSTLLVEGTFDSASASSITSITLGSDGDGGVTVLHVSTWQLDSSGGSVVFKGAGDNVYLVVRATIGSVDHDFLFPTHVVAAEG